METTQTHTIKKYDSIARYSQRGNDSGRFYSPIAVGKINFFTNENRVVAWTEDKEPIEGISMHPDEAVRFGTALIKAGLQIDLEDDGLPR